MKTPTHGVAGQGIVQALIAIALVGIVSAAIASILNDFSKSSRAMAQKLESMDLKNALQMTFINTDNCTCQFSALVNTAKASQLVFNSTPAAGGGRMGLDDIKSSCVGSAMVLARKNALLPGTQTKLKVADIAIEDITATGNADEYLGYITVTFDQTSLVRSLAPIRFPQKFFTVPTSPAVAKTIETCNPTKPSGSGSAGEGEICGLALNSWLNGVQAIRKCQGLNPYYQCPTGYSRIGWAEGNAGGLQYIYHCAKD